MTYLFGRRIVNARDDQYHGEPATMDNYALIERAIRNKEQVIAEYDGYERYMCPHGFGWKGGKRQALFFQFAGGSKSGLPDGGAWRCIPVDALADVRTKPGEWHTGTTAGGQMTCVDMIDIEVSY